MPNRVIHRQTLSATELRALNAALDLTYEALHGVRPLDAIALSDHAEDDTPVEVEVKRI